VKNLSKAGFADLQAMLKYARKQQKKFKKEANDDLANHPSTRHYWQAKVKEIKKALDDNFAAAMGVTGTAPKSPSAAIKPGV
jgi:hypothetical protein